MLPPDDTMHSIQHFAAAHIAESYDQAGIEAADWLPEKGYRANRNILDRLYRYYQALYFKSPRQFLWAGLARLTGGQVMFGMDNLTKIARDPCVLTQEIMAVARAIFEAIAWQHELFLTDRPALLRICTQIDTAAPAVHPYAACWQLVASGNEQDAALGNMKLLQNEQQNTIQPHYDTIKKDAYSARYFRLTRFVMRNIHPHHRRFILQQPFGDVTNIKDRWQWISNAKGMWTTWCALPQAERDRLVALDNEAVIHHRW